MNTNIKKDSAFTIQKNRFDLNGCELKYNNMVFEIGMSLTRFKNIFGEDWVSEKKDSIETGEPYFIYYESKGLEVVIENNSIRDMYIHVQDTYLKYPKVNMVGNKVIVFNNLLLNQTDKMHEYVKLANISFDDIGITSSGYKFEYNCNQSQLLYVLDSPVAYHRKGGGHLSISGDWKLEETNEINSIHIYKKED